MSTPHDPAVAKPASTVVLLRDEDHGIEVFLVRRHDAVAFMGGAYVFPGGRVEDADSDERWLAIMDGITLATDAMSDVTSSAALAFHVAAVRETFEEAGVLLARDPDGRMVSLTTREKAELLRERQAVAAGRTRLVDLVASRHWRLAADAIVYFAHWVTPAIEARRFDTRFFLAAVPPDQVPAHDAEETTDGTWLRPSDAIARCRDGTLALPPPTWTTLRWLEPFSDVASALAWGRQKHVPRIEPGFIQHDDTRIVTLPGDVSMPDVEGFEAKETRFLLSGGRWTPI